MKIVTLFLAVGMLIAAVSASSLYAAPYCVEEGISCDDETGTCWEEFPNHGGLIGFPNDPQLPLLEAPMGCYIETM